MNQKDAVYQYIQQLKPQEVRVAEEGGAPVSLTKQEKKVIERKLFDGFKTKKIQYSKPELPSDDALEIYVSGLVSNWLRKDKRLNGNKTYTPKNPGARTGIPSPTVQPTTIDPTTLAAMQQIAGEGAEVQVLVIRRPQATPTRSDDTNTPPLVPDAHAE